MENLEPNTRLFIVAGKSVDEHVLTEAFREFGTILSVKVVKEKGVAYINYEKASSAAMAIEGMHEKVLNDGRGPMVKVMFAEAPKNGQGRKGGNGNGSGDLGGVPDPDNVPPQSRLFIVVPKTSDGAIIGAEMAKFNDLEYCKTDLIAAKGIVFCKYYKTSSALRALEAVQETGMLANYKVKCMLAEPKGKRGRQEFSGYSDPASPSYQAPAMSFDHVALQQAASLASNFSTGSYLGAYPVSPSHSAFSGASEARAPSLQSAWQPAYQSAFGAVPPHNFHDLWNQLPPQGVPTPASHAAAAEAEASRANRYLIDLQTDALAKGSLNMNAAAARGAINLDRSQPLDHVELAALAQKISKDGLAGMDFSPHTVNALLENYSAGGAASPAPPGANFSQGGQASNSGASPNLHPREAVPTAEPPHEAVQLIARVPLDASEREITQLFDSVLGLMSCRLIVDPGSGFAMGFASIWYSSPAAASQALYRLGGVRHRGETIQVAVASPDAVANALHPVRTSSVISDSNDAYLRRAAREEREEAPESRQRFSPPEQPSQPPPLQPQPPQPTELQIHKTEVAAVQNSLSHLSMPQRPESPRGPILSEAFQQHLPQLKPRRHPSSRQLSGSGPGTEDEAESQSQSQSLTPSPAPDPSQAPNAQQRTVWTVLNRPLPTYALQHYFSSTCGAVQGVKLFADERYGAVTFHSQEAAQKALIKRNTSDICGEALTVLPEDPRVMRNKRARRGP